MDAPEITLDQIIPALGSTPRTIHGLMITHTPNTGSVHVIPCVRSSADAKPTATTATVSPTIRSLTASRGCEVLKPTIHGDSAVLHRRQQCQAERPLRGHRLGDALIARA